MLTYLACSITAYLLLEILRAPRGADATGYLLVSSLIPLPLYIVGNSADAAIFPIDVCLLAYLLTHGESALHYVREYRSLSTGIGVLFGFSVLATCSGVLNALFVDASPLKFYAFTIVKFWEYTALATVLITSKPDAAQLRRLCTIVLVGVLIYEILHALHITGLVPLSGEQYFGPRAAEFDSGEMRAAPFSDRTGWFLTSYRAVVGGTASISAWFSIAVFEAYHSKIRFVAAATAILSICSVLATSSRSDMAGLVFSAIVFAVIAPPRQWKVYIGCAIAVAALYAVFLTFLPAAERTTAASRMSELWNPELRAEGNYADRASDRASLLRYLPDHPMELILGAGPGNFHRYQTERITYNFNGHNSYLHWTGELGIGGFILLIAWCLSVCLFARRRLRSELPIRRLAARTCLALVIGRMAAAWGSECLFGTDGMVPYSMYFVGIVYLLVSIASDPELENSRRHVRLICTVAR